MVENGGHYHPILNFKTENISLKNIIFNKMSSNPQLFAFHCGKSAGQSEGFSEDQVQRDTVICSLVQNSKLVCACKILYLLGFGSNFIQILPWSWIQQHTSARYNSGTFYLNKIVPSVADPNPVFLGHRDPDSSRPDPRILILW